MALGALKTSSPGGGGGSGFSGDWERGVRKHAQIWVKMQRPSGLTRILQE